MKTELLGFILKMVVLASGTFLVTYMLWSLILGTPLSSTCYPITNGQVCVQTNSDAVANTKTNN